MPKRDGDLAAQIKDFRLMNEMTHEEAAAKLGISYGTYYRIIKGGKVTDRIRAIVENRLPARVAA